MKIQIETVVAASLERVWEAWNTPADIMCWNFASDDWQCPSAEVDLRVGGSFKARMEAKDGSFGFDFPGTYTIVEPLRRLAYALPDGRTVQVDFQADAEGVRVTEQFDAEDQNSADMQRAGWQAILDNFRKHVEAGAN
ncbi:MAG: SRPBCC domain-containing protein [Fibrobacteria bacterium]|nr:SRPBCC domain-containing protein [Fibrobacteria bacterium]